MATPPLRSPTQPPLQPDLCLRLYALGLLDVIVPNVAKAA